jgi:hypothetical protein
MKTFTRCGAYSEHWHLLGKNPTWMGCCLPSGHTGPHLDNTDTENFSMVDPVTEVINASRNLLEVLRWLPKGPQHEAMIRLDVALEAIPVNGGQSRPEPPE